MFLLKAFQIRSLFPFLSSDLPLTNREMWSLSARVTDQGGHHPAASGEVPMEEGKWFRMVNPRWQRITCVLLASHFRNLTHQ